MGFSRFWVTGRMAVSPAEIRNTGAGITELRWWEEDEFDSAHSEFEMPPGEQRAHGHKREGVVKSVQLVEISRDREG